MVVTASEPGRQPPEGVARRYAPHGAALLSSVLLGLSFVTSRYAVAEVGPASLGFLRYLVGGLVLLVLALVWQRARFRRRDLVPIVLLGIVQFGLFHLCFNKGLQTVPASRATVLFSLVTVFTLLGSILVGFERARALKVLGVIATFGGAVLAFGDKAGATVAGWHGEGFILIAVLCGSGYNVFSRRYVARYPALALTTLAIFAGVAFMGPFASAEDVWHRMPGFSGSAWAAILFLAVPAGAVSFLLWNWSLARMTPGRVAVFLPLAPITATFAGAYLLGEDITTSFLFGLVFVVVGIWLANYRQAA